MNHGDDRTQQLHHLIAEGADLPTLLTRRPGAQRGADEVFAVSSINQQVVLGRSADCDVVLADDRVSRRHAIVRLLGSRAIIEDAGSTNGTYVDGVRLEGKHELADGAMVRFGRRGPVFRYGRAIGSEAGGQDGEATQLQAPPSFGQ